MAKKRQKRPHKRRLRLSNQIRQAVEDCGVSQVSICRMIRMKDYTLSKFMSGRGWLREDRFDALAELLQLDIVVRKRPRKKRRKKRT